MKSKFNNKKTMVGNRTFDSKKEASRFVELMMLQKAGHITGLTLQPKFEIVPQVKWCGKTLAKRSYVADFEYIENGMPTVEDVKGFRTPVYTLKRQLFLNQYSDYRFIET